MTEENNALDNSEITYTTNPNISSESKETVTPKPEEAPIEINQEFVKPKKNTLFKVLIGIISLLIIIIIIGAILYFTGFFNHKEEIVIQKEEQHIEQPQEVAQQHVEKVEPKEEGYKFNIKDINSKKLNEQLANLTNKNLEKKENDKKAVEETKKEETTLKNHEEELIKQKAELEKQKIEFEKQKAEFEKIKEDSLSQKKETVPQIEQVKQPDETSPENAQKKTLDKETNAKNEFLLFINVVKIKGVLYKKYLDKIIAINPNVKLCRDEKNRIEIYYGPFKSSEERSELLDKLIKNKFSEAYELEFTQEEFDKRCNY